APGDGLLRLCNAPEAATVSVRIAPDSGGSTSVPPERAASPPCRGVASAPGSSISGGGGGSIRLPTRCRDSRRFTFRVHPPRHQRIVRVEVYVNRRLVKRVRAHRITHVTIRRLPQGKFVVKVITHTNRGHRTTSTRTYHGCSKGRPRTKHKRP